MQALFSCIERKYRDFLEIGWHEPLHFSRGRPWVNLKLAKRWGMAPKAELRIGGELFVELTADRLNIWSCSEDHPFFEEMFFLLNP